MDSRDTPLHIAAPSDYLFEQVEDDLGSIESRDVFETHLRELCDSKFIEMVRATDDIILYKAKTGLTWEKLVELSNPIKKKILLQLIENPQNFFVLFNTQKGKLRIMGSQLAFWSTLKDKRAVGYLVVDNDRTLSEQSVNGLFSCFPVKPGFEDSTDPKEKYNVKIYELSSNNKTSMDEVITYIDAYAYNDSYPMPLIVVLANNKQIEKLVRILYHIKTHRCKQLCAAGGWDEADKTYPQYRNKAFNIHGKPVSFLDILVDSEKQTILQNGFVTATEGALIEEEYEECANAHHFVPEIDPEDAKNYVAFHNSECIKHDITVRSRETNNVIAERVLNEHMDVHFKVPLKLKDGTPYHHKVIINADVKADEMHNFAMKFRNVANVITFNMRGLRLYTDKGDYKTYSVRKENLNKLLFYVYKMNKLENRLLIIIGRRKVDRGLGFHYAPRSKWSKTLTIEGKDGILHTDGIEGLIWTDMIMGNKIEHIPTAVQKAGRGAGIIRQCPQYPGEFHYWIDRMTASCIEHHYKKVDKTNELKGTNSLLQAVTHANALIKMKKYRHDVDEKLFRVIKGNSPEHTLELVKQLVSTILNESYRKPSQDESGKYKTSLNTSADVVSLLDAVKKVPGAYGTVKGVKKYRRFLSCYGDMSDENTLHCVIPLIDPAYTEDMKSRIDTVYKEYIVKVPQVEDSHEDTNESVMNELVY